MEDHIDTHVLKEIRAWYEHQLQIKESGTSYYLTKRINQINMLLLQSHEKDYLLSLNALFLMKDKELNVDQDFEEVMKTQSSSSSSAKGGRI